MTHCRICDDYFYEGQEFLIVHADCARVARVNAAGAPQTVAVEVAAALAKWLHHHQTCLRRVMSGPCSCGLHSTLTKLVGELGDERDDLTAALAAERERRQKADKARTISDMLLDAALKAAVASEDERDQARAELAAERERAERWKAESGRWADDCARMVHQSIDDSLELTTLRAALEAERGEVARLREALSLVRREIAFMKRGNFWNLRAKQEALRLIDDALLPATEGEAGGG